MNIENLEVEKIANIVKRENDEKLKVEKLRKLPKGKLTLIETNNGEITNVFESSSPNSALKFYEDGGIQGNGKPCESNFAKHELAKQDLIKKRIVEIYISSRPKKEILNAIKGKDGKYPSKNFQLNKERIPKEIVDKLNKIKQERNKKNDIVKDSNDAGSKNENK